MPRRLGDSRLRYDAELLIGERVPPLDARALIPDALVLGGMAVGVVAVATLVAPGLRTAGVWGTVAAAAVAAAATVAGLRMGALRRGRRGFVVNFDRHTVRVDEPQGLRLRSATTVVPFREVTSVEVRERGPGRSALVVLANARELVLLDSAADGERDQLERLRRVLEAAVSQDAAPPADLTPPGGA